MAFLKDDYYMRAMGELIECQKEQERRRAVPLVFDEDTLFDLVVIVDKRHYRITTINETDSTIEVRIERK